MSPFIKYTHKTEHTSGPREELVFINADFISKAVYDENEELLTLIVAASLLDHKSSEKVEIKGEEAREAMKIIREL